MNDETKDIVVKVVKAAGVAVLTTIITILTNKSDK